MKKTGFLLMMALFISTACLTTGVKRERADMTPTVIPIIVPTATPIQPPTEAVVGTQEAFSKITFSIPAGLPVRAKPSISTNIEFPMINPSGGLMAEHTVVQFSPYPLAGTARIAVFKSTDYAAYDDSLKTTIDALAAGQDSFQPLPKSLAGNFYASARQVTFKNGHGIRYLTQAMSGYAPVNNGDLIYFFQGISKDGQYFISAIFPINAPFLVPDGRNSSTLPEGGIAFPANPDAPGAFSQYLDEISQKLNGTDAAGFTPSLAQLDVLIGSLEIK
jgi:hypothetical protein